MSPVEVQVCLDRVVIKIPLKQAYRIIIVGPFDTGAQLSEPD